MQTVVVMQPAPEIPKQELDEKELARLGLSGREQEVLQLIADGMRNKEIAGTLGISEETVHTHLKNTYEKLGVNDRTHALTVAIRRGIIHVR